MHHLIFGINFQIHLISLVSPVSIHLVIHLSTNPCHHHHSQSSITPSLFHSRLKTPFQQILSTILDFCW